MYNHRINEIMAYLELSLGMGIAFGPILAFLLKFLFSSHVVLFILLGTAYLIIAIFYLRFIPEDIFGEI